MPHKVKNTEIRERIQWIDYYKTILIILVVTGHSTALFNPYIYQFHVAVFFMISGYTSKLYKKSTVEIVTMRTLTLMVPYVFFAIAGVSAIWIVNKIGLLHYLSIIPAVPTYKELVTTIFTWLRCDWLGASWFITVLFGAVMIQKIILLFSGNRISILYGFITVVLYVETYRAISMGIQLFKIPNFNTMGLAQMYFGIGMAMQFFCSKYGIAAQKLSNKGMVAAAAGVVCTGVLLYIFKNKFFLLVDIVSNQINNPGIDLALAVNGGLFLYCVTRLLERICPLVIYRVVSYIGSNTLGIMFLHFIGFKVCTLLLFVTGRASLDDFAALTVPGYLSGTWWWLYVAVAIGFSIVCWEIIKRIRYLKTLSGADQGFAKAITKQCVSSGAGGVLVAFEGRLNEAVIDSNSDFCIQSLKDKVLFMAAVAIAAYIILVR